MLKPSITSKSLDTIINFMYENPNHNIKQIFYVEKLNNDKIGYYSSSRTVVGEKQSQLCNREGVNNAIIVEHKYRGIRSYYGKGVVGRETTSVIINELIDAIYNYVQPKSINKQIDQINL